MRLKRLICCALSTAVLAGLLVLPPAGAAGTAGFTDISDPAVAEAAEMLRLLGVVDGTGGSAFNPGGTLTRAEFCKMAVEVMGRGGEEPAQRNRTIFTDVGSTFWARGYINLAASITIGGSGEDGASGGTRLVMGVGDGTFHPNDAINYGQAVTILMRVLGYGSADVATGGSWYDGYVALAQSSGLSDGLTLSGDSTITRGQAAILFYNLLFTDSKDSDQIYLTTLGGREEDGGILLDVNATAADGTRGVRTTTGVYRTNRTVLDESLEGMPGSVVLDEDGKLLAFQPRENITSRAVSVSQWAYNQVRLNGGEELDVDPQSTVYLDGEAHVYEDLWQDLRPGTPATFYYTADGELDYVFLRASTTASTAMVARSRPSGNPFASLTGGDTGYQIYKNGVPATTADIRQYDVATYDRAAKVMNISDLRLTGMYEDVYPNTDTPARITVMGVQLEVLSSAAADLRNFKIGDTLTVLLTRDGQVAGAVTPSAATSTAVGYVEKIDPDTGAATIQLLNDVLPTLEGRTSYRNDNATQLMGELVAVSSYRVGQLSLSRLTRNSGGVTGTLDVAARTLGGSPLAENVSVYEKVGNSALHPVDYDQITCDSVPSTQILYASEDYAGRCNVLVLDDVTGDLYTYGFLNTGRRESGSWNGDTIYNPTILVESAGESASGSTLELFGSVQLDGRDVPGGIVASLDDLSGTPRLAGYVTLHALTGVRRSAFNLNDMVLTTPDLVLPVSENVVCYNATTERWFTGETPKDALNQARAYSDNLTVYYDRTPEDGGKVRLVVVG